MWQVSNLILFAACFGSFAWSIARFFEKPAEKKKGMTAISACGSLFILIHALGLLFYRNANNSVEGLGSLLYCAALALFWGAVRANRQKPLTLAYSEDRPEHLVTGGPYQYVRHPFYTAYTLAWLAGVLASGRPALLLTAAVMFFLYYRAALLEEKKFAASPLAESYEQYKAATGRFFPFRYPF